jgi:manganese/zinc/iron transport system substrate-binding protein
LVTAHDAFGYFGKQYGVNVIGIQGISTAAEANTKDIQNIVNVIIKKNIPTIFIESSVPVRQINAVKAAVKAKGNTVEIGQPLFTDAMGSAGTPEGTYIGMIKHNVSSIVNGLK